MSVVERLNETSRSLLVTPIGSCRIAAPLGVAAKRYSFELNRSKVYGYCHSSLEAVQMIRFLQGDYHPNARVWPVMSRNLVFEEAKAEIHKLSDVYVVEISSAKQVTYQGHAVQLNYLQTRYSEFFSSSARSKSFWDAAETGKTFRVISENDDETLSPLDREFLSDIQLSYVDAATLDSHLNELKERLPNLVIATHVNAIRETGKEISSRVRLINEVQSATNRLRLQCFNPTEAMQRLGQKRAMDISDCLTHYSQEFVDQIADALYLGPICNSLEISTKTSIERKQHVFRGLESSPQPNLSFLGKRRLQRLAPLPSSDTLVHSPKTLNRQPNENRGYVQKTAGNDKSYRADRLNFQDENFGLAFEFLGEFKESAKVFEALIKKAPNYAQCVAFLQVREKAGMRGIVPTQAMEILLSHSSLENIIHFVRTKGALLLLLKKAESELEQRLVADRLLATVAPRDRIKTLTKINAITGNEHLTNEIGSRYSGGFVDYANRLSDPWQRLAFLESAQRVASQSSSIRRHLSAVKKKLKEAARSHFRNSNFEELEGFFVRNSQSEGPIVEIELLHCRAIFKVGEFAKAESIAESIAERCPNNLNAWIVAMRASLACNHIERAATFADRVIQIAKEKDTKYVSEATEILQNCRSAA